MDAIDRVPRLGAIGAHARERLLNQRIDCRNYAYENGIDRPEIVNWKWPF
jgi:xylulose-5-phosphate/fructose-6-phosphate phosphoketolase